MSSSLAQQLGALAKQHKLPRTKVRGKPSLLFDLQAAADVDLQTIYQIGCQGLDDLCRLDPRFAQYRSSLFSQAATTFVRDAQTPDVLQVLDDSISGFLCLLSNHFLAPAAFKALEYLIRRYRVNEFNIETLLLCGLPYHGTNEFVRLAQTMVLEDSTGWQWLAPMQKSGASLPREVLVRRCVNDPAVLAFVCEGAKRLGQKQSSGRTYLSFYAVAMCEIVASHTKVTEELVERLLPYIVEGLAASASTDFRAATLMVLAEMASRAQLNAGFLAAVIVSMLQGMESSPEHVKTVLLVLSHLASTQQHLKELPTQALQALLSVPTLISELQALSQARSRVAPLVRVLVDSLVQQLLSGAVATAGPLADLAHAGLLDAQHAQAVAERLLVAAAAAPAAAAPRAGKKAKAGKAAATAAAAEEGVRAAVQKLLRVLEGRYAEALDAAINATLGTDRPSAGEDEDEDGDAGMGEAGGGAVSAGSRALYDFVNDTFAGTAHAVCAGSGRTLMAAFGAPQAGMRRLALEQADELLSEPAGGVGDGTSASALPAESRTQLHAHALSAIAGDDGAIARAALKAARVLAAAEGASPGVRALAAAVGSYEEPEDAAAAASPATEKKKEQRARQARALQTGCLAALSQAVASQPAALQEAARLAAVAAASAADAPGHDRDEGRHLRARHALLLATNAAVQRLRASPSADARTPAASKGRGKAAASAAASSSAPTLSDAASSLQQLCYAELRLIGPTHADAFRSWQDDAARLLDVETGAPGPEHASRAATALPSAHAAVLCKALLNALKASVGGANAAAAGTASGGAQLHSRFLEVSALVPAAAFQEHLLLLLRSSLPSHAQQQAFLQQLYAAPTSTSAPLSAQVAALRLHATLGLGPATFAAPPSATPTKTPSKSQAAAAAAAASQQPWLPYLLAAAASPHPEVRAEAAACVAALGAAAPAAPPAAAAIKSAAEGLGAHAALLLSDASAAEQLIAAALAPDAAAPSTSAVAATPAASSRKRKAAKDAAPLASSSSSASGQLLPPSADARKALAGALASSLPALSNCTASDLAAATAVLASLQPAWDALELAPSERSALLTQPALQLLRALPRATAPGTVPTVAALAPALIGLLACPPALSSSSDGAEVAAALAALLPGAPAIPSVMLPLRSALLRALAASAALLPALQAAAPATRVPSFAALTAAAAGDASEECRRAARAVLEAAEVSDEVLVPLLETAVAATAAAPAAVAEPAEDKKKRAKQVKEQNRAAEAEQEAQQEVSEERLGTAVMVLELLQWKTGIVGAGRVVAAAQALLAALMPRIGSVVVPHGGDEGAAGGDAVDAEEQGTEGARSSLAGYAAQLVMSGVEALLRQEQAGEGCVSGVAEVLRPELAVRAAQDAPDAAVRNAALSLVAAAAGAMPEAVLGHVLQVLSVIHRSAAVQDDQHSQQVCASAMAALVPAWLSGGRAAEELWAEVVGALPGVLPHRRLALLSALMVAMPQESGLPVALQLLLQKATDAPAPAPVASTSGVTPQPGDPAAGPGPSEWLPELAAQLASQAEPAARLDALSSLLAQSLDSCQGRAYTPLPRLAVAFTTTQLLKMRGLASDPFPADAAAAPGASSRLHAACEPIMQRALAHMQALTQPLAGLQKAEGAKGAKATVQRACKAALEGVYALLAALQGVLPSDKYLRALGATAKDGSDKLRRRALRLFAEKVRGLPAELEALSGRPQRERLQHEERLAKAALLPYEMLAAADAPTAAWTPLAQQALLGAATGAAAAFGRARPDAVLAALPAALRCCSGNGGGEGAAPAAPPALRGSALVLVAASAKAIGVRMVPQLPAAMQALLTCGKEAAAALSKAATAVVPVAAATAAPKTADKSASKAAAAAAAAAEEEDEATGSAEDAAAVLAAAVLAALTALVESLGGFLSPYLSDALALLVHPSLLACSAAGVAASAAAARAWLPGAVPPRLLLEPLFGTLPRAVEGGPASAGALLEMVTTTITGMDTRTAAAHHEQVFMFLLRVLDVRAAAPPSLAGATHDVEAAAVRALVALIMKLTESRFKPLFTRLVDWAEGGGDDGAGGGVGAGAGAAASGRQIALFAVAAALTERLRSVFVPYFRYLLEKAVKHLTGGTDKGGPVKKKARKPVATAAAEAARDVEGGGGGGEAETARWVLRLRVVRALHRALLHDTVGFFDAERLDRLLGPLVAQLEGPPPPVAVAAALAAQCAAPDLDGFVLAAAAGQDAAVAAARHEAYDVMGVAAVACLVQLGLTANSDVFWKPLNHRVLMATRSASSVRARLLAVEVVAQLVARLREEYLVLLPETIPFLAELLEDPETAVEARAQQLVALLEDISGEKLDQYMQ